MAGKAQFRASLNIFGPSNLRYTSPSTAFNVSLSLGIGPTPGGILIATNPGTQINISLLTTPGPVFIYNYDKVNWFSYGIYDPATHEYYPLGECGPGEGYPLKLYRKLGEEYHNTGTGVPGPEFWARADTAPVQAFIGAFNA